MAVIVMQDADETRTISADIDAELYYTVDRFLNERAVGRDAAIQRLLIAGMNNHPKN